MQALLDDLPCLAGQARQVSSLPGGLTNRNYRVRTATQDLVVRVSPPGTDLLAVDRDAEHANSMAAAQAGVGAPVVDYLPGRGVLVVGFLPGITYGDDDVAGNLPRIAASLRRLHAGPAFVNRFDMFEIQPRYQEAVLRNGFRMPDGYLDLAPQIGAIKAALAVAPDPVVPCHNDLLAGNFLDDGGDIRIIDYEYSGMNEPSFELGNIISEARLSHDHLDELITAYYGGQRPSKVARAELWSIVARYGWTLWGMISDGIGNVDFDFWAWSMERFEPAAALMTSPRLATLIDAVNRPDPEPTP